MRVTKKFGLLALLLVATLLAQSSSATLLPPSSYAYAQGNWEGTKYFDIDAGDLHGYVSYSVYDTDQLNWDGEKYLGTVVDDAGMDGQYIYAYQVHNDTFSSLGDILHFQVLDEDGKDLDGSSINDISALEDTPNSGLEPSIYSPIGIWKFVDSAAIIAGQHSWFLVLTSDFEPVVGNYTMTVQGEQGSPPIPEPGTIALLGLGGAVILRRKKSVK